MKDMWLFDVTFGIFAICCLGIALRGIFSRRPIIFSSRWMLMLFLLVFVPLLARGAALFGSHFRLGSLLPLLMPLLVLSLLFRNAQGYSILGVSDEYFSNALHAALHKLGLPFEESLSQIRLTSLDAALIVTLQSRMGAAQLAIKPSLHRSTLKEIVQLMRDYFATVPGKTNLTTYVYYLLFGALMVVFAIYFSRHI